LTRLRLLLLAVAALFVTGLLVAGCGGDSGGDEDPQQVLDETFNGDHTVNSGVIDISLSGSAEGEDGGSFEASINGPFQGNEDKEGALPQFDLTGSISGEDSQDSIDIEGSLILAEDAAYVTYQDETYEIPEAFVAALQQASEQAQKQADKQQQDAQGLLDQFGVEPENWLTNLTNEGDEDVEGTNTIHIHGDADVPAVLDDLESITKQTGEAAPLTQAEIDQVEDAIDEASIDVYSGADDRILRKLDLNLALTAPEDSDSSVDSVEASFSVTLAEVNEDQTIEAPSDAKSFGELEQQLGLPPGVLEQALGGGTLGGGSLGGGALGGGAVQPEPGTTSNKYLDCLSQATTAEELQACEP
jgi:hypothetical protein